MTLSPPISIPARILIGVLCAVSAQLNAAPSIVALGDSIGEGVQAADANEHTQPHVYLNWIAKKMGAQFSQPIIRTSPVGSVGTTLTRERVMPQLGLANLAVSGSDLDDLFTDRADAARPEDIDSETDLVLFPRLGSQVEIAEQWAPTPAYIICWAGSNEILRTATAWDTLDASQMTPVVEFGQDFGEIVHRLAATGSRLVLANIPDVTQIGFLMDNQDLNKFLGLENALPPGHRTTLISMLMIRLGFEDVSILQDPDYVLDPREIALIQQRVREYNYVIALTANQVGAPVVDVHGLLQDAIDHPPMMLGHAVTPRFLGGWLSLDGVHPSNTGHALLANAFIEKINAHYGTAYPVISDLELLFTWLRDPHVDRDGDGVAPGRPIAGLLETLGPALGISGDWNDYIPHPVGPADESVRQHLLAVYRFVYGGMAELEGLGDPALVRQALENALGVNSLGVNSLGVKFPSNP